MKAHAEPPRRSSGGIELRVATYNVHRCIGLDRRRRPHRIAEVLADVGADVIALQEVVGAGRLHPAQAEEIGAALAMGWVMAPTRQWRGHQYGNVVLSRFPIKQQVLYDLSWRTCEPRGCQRADLLIGDGVFHVYNVHLGTALHERRHQAERLAALVRDHRVPGPKIVLGDFNEWSRGLATRVLQENLESIDIAAHLKHRRTYPGIFPLLHLDHIYYQGRIVVQRVSLPRTRKSLMASDHLPLVADLRVTF